MSYAPPRALEQTDDLSRFDCGRASLNIWLRRNAWRNQASGVSRVSVIVSANEIVGFVSLSASHVERAFLPKPLQRNNPDPIPVTLLGQLAVDQAHQGRRCATSLLRYAMLAAWRASQQVASFGVLTHPIDDSARNFYARWGFENLPLDPKQAVWIRMKDVGAWLEKA